MEDSKSSNNSRRRFLKIASHAIGGTLAAGVVAPVVGLAIHPWMKDTVYGTEDFINIGKVDEFPVGVPKKMTITSSRVGYGFCMGNQKGR